MLREWLVTFAQDSKVHIAFLLLIADFILGVGSALKPPVTFRLSYLVDTFKRDVLGKLLPYLALYILALVQGSETLVIPGLDFGLIAGAAYVGLVAALAGSILNSLAKLGISLPATIAGDEADNTTGDAPATVSLPTRV